MARYLDYQFVRFGLVGTLNTGIDIALYVLLLFLTGSVLLANTISTGTALTVSLFLNKQFTFRVMHLSAWQLAVFVVGTLIGLWVLQPLIILFSHPILEDLLRLDGKNELIILSAKIIAIAFTVMWNYVLYKYVVFRKIK
jgi:putative flippase GtrA